MGDREFDWNFAAAVRSGVIKRAINRYKYRDVKGWAVIFGRIVTGFLDYHYETFDDFDLIIPSPTYVGPEEGARSWDHTAAVLESAAEISDWPFHLSDPQLVVKTHVTPKMVRLSYQERRDLAENELRSALKVTDRATAQGRQILVYDDVFTDGLTLREVARVLKRAGAERVCGITLTRQPFGGSPRAGRKAA